MDQILDAIFGVDPVVLGAIGAGVLLLLVLAGVLYGRRAVLRRRLRAVGESPGRAQELVLSRYAPARLLRAGATIEKIARETGGAIIEAIGIDELWMDRLIRKRGKRDFERVLEFFPDRGLFVCFLVGLEKREFGVRLQQWIDRTEEFLGLRRIALSGRGQEFDGALALEMFRERIDEIREMTGDPEWAPRYFAVKIMIADGGERSERGLWDAFGDAHPLVRKTVASGFLTEDEGRLIETLTALCLDDPVFEVRAAAKARLRSDFADRYTIDPASLDNMRAVHLLQLLEPRSSEDEDLAVRYLDSDDLELRLPAALYLQQTGVLSRLLSEATFGDREALDRTERLLTKAAEVHVDHFLDQAIEEAGPAQLLVASRLLRRFGNQKLIAPVLRRAFALDQEVVEREEVIAAAFAAVNERGDEASLVVLRDALAGAKNNPHLAGRILETIPERAGSVFASLLRELLVFESFDAEDELKDAILRLDSQSFVPQAMEIITAGREAYSHRVRIRALTLLGRYEQPYLVQFILEHLSVLPEDEARSFAITLAEYSGKVFDQRVETLLASPDAKVRAAIILSLPATGKKTFLKQIKEAVGDADPEVRIASVWAIAGFGDSRSLTQASERLRDPVERVRVQTARAIGAHGTETAIDVFRTIIDDENEVDAVKAAAVEGLGFSAATRSIDILVGALEGQEQLVAATTVALARKTSKKDLSRLIEQFKDADPSLRDKLTTVFKAMGEDGEQTMVELLAEGIESLAPLVAEILESIGYVEAMIRKLSHRDPEVRRGAAESLSFVGTLQAFRGIVLAARDPDEQVRIRVTKALERLAGESGNKILGELEQDPDGKVRKYTLWALQRIKARSLTGEESET